jgi:hypothetical protein
MDQIPLGPIGQPEEPPQHFTDAEAATPKRRSIFGKFFRGVGWLSVSPVHWMGVKSIRQGASFIGDLADRAKAPSKRDSRFKTAGAGQFDLQATAFSMGITVFQLERHLLARRRQTALTSYVFGALGSVFLLVWFLKVISTPIDHGDHGTALSGAVPVLWLRGRRHRPVRRHSFPHCWSPVMPVGYQRGRGCVWPQIAPDSRVPR